MLDSWRHMLVMRVCALQTGIIWVRLRIIPTQLFIAVPYFIAIPINHSWQSGVDQPLANDYANIVFEEELTSHPGQGFAATNKG